MAGGAHGLALGRTRSGSRYPGMGAPSVVSAKPPRSANAPHHYPPPRRQAARSTGTRARTRFFTPVLPCSRPISRATTERTVAGNRCQVRAESIALSSIARTKRFQPTVDRGPIQPVAIPPLERDSHGRDSIRVEPPESPSPGEPGERRQSRRTEPVATGVARVRE